MQTYGHSFSKHWTASRALRTLGDGFVIQPNNSSLSNGLVKCYADLAFSFCSHQKMTHRAKERESVKLMMSDAPWQLMSIVSIIPKHIMRWLPRQHFSHIQIKKANKVLLYIYIIFYKLFLFFKTNVLFSLKAIFVWACVTSNGCVEMCAFVDCNQCNKAQTRHLCILYRAISPSLSIFSCIWYSET